MEYLSIDIYFTLFYLFSGSMPGYKVVTAFPAMILDESVTTKESTPSSNRNGKLIQNLYVFG